MTHEHTLDRLDDYVGGELPPREERDVRRHLMQCDGCRAEEQALRALLDEAAALPEIIAPPRDLWRDIAPRLQARTEAAPAPAAAPERTDEIRTLRPRTARPLPGWMLAAASLALVVTTSFATLRLSGGGADETALPAQQAQAPATAGTPTALASFAPAEQEYAKAIGDLESVLEQHRDRLAPQTVTTLEANLALIDQAIRESREALAADPNSPALARMLNEAYGAKINVLRHAVSL